MSRTAVLALGGNALSHSGERATIANQFRHARESVAPIVELARDGWNIAIVHGNGPQVGDELVRHELASAEAEPLPLGVLVAGTAGWIGYMLQQSLENGLADAGVDRPVITIITQTEVDPSDPGLERATKPIGHEMPQSRADLLRATGIPVGKDGAGRWRRLAASPLPIGIVEAALVRSLVHAGVIVIAAGGGGPPVYRDPLLGFEGLDAVVDKDLVASLLATGLEANVLLILTDVDGVYRNWGAADAKRIPRMSLDEADALIGSGTVPAGSMQPKLEAAIEFVRAGGDRAVIARLADGPAALRGETGTTIARET